MWVFGYGSIIFKPGFDSLEERAGFIRGWSRRFWQASPDHRGVPERPGRVVTLLRDSGGFVGGLAFRLEGAEADRILAELDQREKAGYERHWLPVFADPVDGDTPIVDEALVYVAGQDNPNFLGPTPVEEIAAHALGSIGPSGRNVDYILKLDAALERLDMPDVHVRDVAEALRRLERAQKIVDDLQDE